MPELGLAAISGALTSFLAVFVFNRFIAQGDRASDSIGDIRVAIAELRVLVSKLDSDLKQLWKVRDDVNHAWSEIRRMRSGSADRDS